ncbi:gp60 [Burkholderia pseudomallei]|nr:gp60 [Burkholderia pseudomallei]CAJ9315943.1 gp60 [Burkholderia pseudomallei]
MWCEHREAKHKDAPWIRGAAIVSIRKLTKLREQGQDPKACIEEAVLRGWTGLFPVKSDGTTASGQDVPADWNKSAQGVTERGKQLGIEQRDGEVFMRFKARVVKAAGPGEAMEEMLREANRFGNETYEQLYRYFNDIPRDQEEA